jgi:uncharacterized protein DUF1572
MGHDAFFQRLTEELAALFRRDIDRLTQEIHAFPDDASLWQIVPGVNNCAGNLVLHLEGNLREYVGRRLGGVPYQRNRAAEFSQKGLSRLDLLTGIESLSVVPEILKRISEEQWLSECGDDPLPGARSTGQFLMSIYGHFHYHLGQIDYLRRILTNGTAISFAQLESSS